MNNPNSRFKRLQRIIWERWLAEDYPGATPRFQAALFTKDFATYIFLPVAAIILFRACESGFNQTPKRNRQQNQKSYSMTIESGKSQIIDFGKGSGTGTKNGYGGISKRSPGTLVKVKLLNVVETYSTAPVHAQITDASLGKILAGGTLIGDANPDVNFEKININFRFARDPNRENVAIPISARALSLDGTLGLDASKKEGFFTRSAYSSATGATQEAQARMNGAVDFKEILFRALTAGMVQEFGNGARVEQNRSQILTLAPSVEFFAELTDFFPGGIK